MDQNMVSLRINDIPVTVPAGTTVLEAARSAGFNIPSLCFLKDINEIGACRICVVEVKGAKSLVASCVYPVAEGMEVLTNSTRVFASRKIDLELILADAEMVERRIDKAQKAAKGDKKFLHEVEVFQGLLSWLNDGKSARSYDCDEDDKALIATSDLLTLKPVIYAANLDEDGFADCENVGYYQQVKARAASEGAQVIPVCAKLEAEIAELEGEEKAMFLEDLGVHESGLDRLIRASYALLGLISFLTSGEDECRAWTIVKGTKAPQAAGKIHSDFERGFIRAEVIAYDDLMAVGSMAAAREKGMIRSEGKEYVVQDGDIILFRFNV